MEITTARILDKRRMLKKTKTYRLAIRVTFNRKPVSFLLDDLHLSETDFKKLSSPRLGKELSRIRDKLIKEENRAKEIISSLGTFTFDAFREEFYRHKRLLKQKAKTQKIDDAAIARDNNLSPLFHCAEGRTKRYGTGKCDKVRSNVNYAAWGPVAVAFGEYIKILDAQERIGVGFPFSVRVKSRF
jgi:hypothetical protein